MSSARDKPNTVKIGVHMENQVSNRQ